MTKCARRLTQTVGLEAAVSVPISSWLYMSKLYDGMRQLAISSCDVFSACNRETKVSLELKLVYIVQRRTESFQH